jgi:2-dehydro-3-deoxygalactonokinase
MIGIDWGTTSFRAFRIARDGTIRDRRASPRGILNVPDNRFGETLREEIGPWLAAGDDHVLLSGMIGSRQGWKEAPYLSCPAGAPEIAAALTEIPFDWGQVKLVPGLATEDAAGVPEVMRGEETQIVGCLAAIGGAGLACLPGSHSKWARIEAGRIAGFTTHLTGEAFAALRGHTILARMMRDGATDPVAFDQGVTRSGDWDGLLHHVFGARTLALTERMAESATASYLSGILIGHGGSVARHTGADRAVRPRDCRLRVLRRAP